MTFKEIQDDALERATFNSGATNSTARTRIKRFINQTYRQILRETGLGKLVRSTAQITTVGNQAEYPVTCASVRLVRDAVRGRALDETTLTDILTADPALSNVSSVAEMYAVTQLDATTVTVRLYPTPLDSDVVYDLEVAGAATPLTDDSDVPVVPEDWHYLLSTGARMLEAEKMQQWDSYQVCKNELEAGIRKLRLYIAKSRKGQSTINRKGTFNATYGGVWIDWGLG